MIGANRAAFINRRKARFRIKLCCWLYRHGLYGLAEKVNRVWYEYMANMDTAAAVKAGRITWITVQDPRTGERTRDQRGGDHDH